MSAFLVGSNGGNGLTYAQTRGNRFHAPTVGVRTTDDSWLETVRAVALLLPEGAAFSHVTALQLLGVPFENDSLPLHVTVPRGTTRGTRSIVSWHHSDLTRKRRKVMGLTVTTALKTWLDLGAVLDVPELVAVTDLLLKKGLVTREQLVVPRGIRGAQALRWAAEFADPRSNSVRESELRVHMNQHGLPAPDLNADIIIDGVWIAVSDFVWWLYKVIVEYDGAHHDTLDQRHQDVLTRDALRDAGWLVKALTAKHYKRLPATLGEIENALIGRGWQPNPTDLPRAG